jgi:hypothetical protein
VFSETSLGFEIPENVRTVSHDEIFWIPGNPRGFFGVFSCFTAVATYKICKISRFWVFSGTDFPISGNREFRPGTHFVHFGNLDFGNPDPENPVFTETALRRVPLRDRGNWDFWDFGRSRGHFTIDKKFPETEILNLTLLHTFFFGCSCFRVQRCEKVKTSKTPKWHFGNLHTFSRNFSEGCFRVFTFNLESG